MPVAAAREIADALPTGVGGLAVIGEPGIPWLDRPDRYWLLICAFVEGTVRGGLAT